jgi:hypothetical protein
VRTDNENNADGTLFDGGGVVTPVTGGVVTGGLQHVVFTFDGGGGASAGRLYVDGVAVMETRAFGVGFDNWDPAYDIAVGNELPGGGDAAPWHGTVFLAAIYDGALDAAEVARHRELGPNGTRGVAGGVDVDHDAVVDALDSCPVLADAARQTATSSCP